MAAELALAFVLYAHWKGANILGLSCFVRTYKGSVPRAADAARYAGARKISTKNVKGAERRGP